MKKYTILFIALLIFYILFTGCKKELSSENVTTKITTYAVITMNGDNPMYMPVGSTYTEPGATTNTGDPVTIHGTVDGNVESIYHVDYKSTNEDGFPYKVTRTVVVSTVVDSSYDISGTYNGLFLYQSTQYRASNIKITSTDVTGLFHVSDLLAGLYSDALAYGSLFRSPGYIKCIGDSIALVPNNIDPWDYPLGGSGHIVQPDSLINLHIYEIPKDPSDEFAFDWGPNFYLEKVED